MRGSLANYRLKNKLIRALAFVLAVVLALGWALLPAPSSAATLTGGSLSLSSSAISATNVTYTIDFSGVSTSAIKCISVRITDTLGSNSKPTGVSVSSAALSSSSDYIPTPASWTVTPNDTTGVVNITYATGETPALASNRTVILTGITNGSTKNTTYYLELDTYNNTDCSSSSVDSGDVAFAYSEGVTVSATVNSTLTFTVDSTTCALGTLSTSTASSCSHTMTAATNGASGYSISYIATNTLTSGASDTITAIGATATTSSTGSEQFGINLVANTTPSVGANPSGGSGSAASNYDTADNFAFNTSGASVASASGPSATTTYTVSYIANISPTTEAGTYTTTMTYNITANY